MVVANADYKLLHFKDSGKIVHRLLERAEQQHELMLEARRTFRFGRVRRRRRTARQQYQHLTSPSLSNPAGLQRKLRSCRTVRLICRADDRDL